jgi:hypothetical protein
MTEPDDLQTTIDQLSKSTARIEHLLRMSVDAIDLLERCFDEGDLPPDLAVDVGTLLLRISDLPS